MRRGGCSRCSWRSPTAAGSSQDGCHRNRLLCRPPGSLHRDGEQACAVADHYREGLLGLLDPEAAEHKQVYFASGWAHYETAAAGGIHLVPPDTRLKELAQDYDLMRDMFFGPFPKIEEILTRLQELEREINAQ